MRNLVGGLIQICFGLFLFFTFFGPVFQGQELSTWFRLICYFVSFIYIVLPLVFAAIPGGDLLSLLYIGADNETVFSRLCMIFVYLLGLLVFCSLGFHLLIHLLQQGDALQRTFNYLFVVQHLLSGFTLDITETYGLDLSGVRHDPANRAEASLVLVMHIVGNLGLGALVFNIVRSFMMIGPRASG